MKTKRLLFLQACIMLLSFSVMAETTIYQAENKTAGQNATVASSNAGFNGTGYIEMANANGNYFEWNNVAATTAGTADIRFRYTNSDGSQRARSCDIYVNTVLAGSYTFPWVTGGWAAWAYSTQVMTVNLNAGNNTIRVQINSTSASSPKIDEMEVVIGTPTVFNVETVAVDPGVFSFFIGQSAILKAIVLPAVAANKKVTWASDNAAVTVIAETGYITAISIGTANITATSEDGNKVGSCVVHVLDAAISTGTNPNLILNPGFEEGLNWWSTWGGQTLSTNPLDAATGVNACFVLDGVAGGFAQDVTLPVGGAGKTYLFKAKVKTTGMPQLAQTGCKLFEGTKEINSPSYITVENKDIPYTEYVYAIETTAATTKAQIWVWKNATGSIYLDDYSFAEVDLASGLKTNSLLESLSVYPNPAKDVVNIDFQSKIENAQVSISDLTGKSVYKNSINSVNKIRISTANFAKGIYVLSISTKGETSNMKLVVQ